MENKAGVIYKAVNKKTGDTYIGATTKNIKDRIADHLDKSSRNEEVYFHIAISTYGVEAFEWEQIDTANNLNELAIKEKEYIIKYNSLHKGYNSDSGGGFKKAVYQFDLNTGALLAEYDCLYEASIAVASHKNCIANVCSGQNKSCKGFHWSYNSKADVSLAIDSRKRSVVQFDLDGNMIEIFESAAEASRQTGVSKTCISRCCRGERKKSGGFIWKY